MTAAPVSVRGVSRSIKRVDFFQGNLLIGTSTGANAQYVFTWNDVPAGSYTFTARASDAQNATVRSTPITVHCSAI
jgi:hypothetical protein